MLRANLPRTDDGLDSIAYPYGEWDESPTVRPAARIQGGIHGQARGQCCLRPVARHQPEPGLLRLARPIQPIQEEPQHVPCGAHPPRQGPAMLPEPAPRDPRQLVAAHNARSQEFESRGWLRQALDETRIALTIDTTDAAMQKRRDALSYREGGRRAHGARSHAPRRRPGASFSPLWPWTPRRWRRSRGCAAPSSGHPDPLRTSCVPVTPRPLSRTSTTAIALAARTSRRPMGFRRARACRRAAPSSFPRFAASPSSARTAEELAGDTVAARATWVRHLLDRPGLCPPWAVSPRATSTPGDLELNATIQRVARIVGPRADDVLPKTHARRPYARRQLGRFRCEAISNEGRPLLG